MLRLIKESCQFGHVVRIRLIHWFKDGFLRCGTFSVISSKLCVRQHILRPQFGCSLLPRTPLSTGQSRNNKLLTSFNLLCAQKAGLSECVSEGGTASEGGMWRQRDSKQDRNREKGKESHRFLLRMFLRSKLCSWILSSHQRRMYRNHRGDMRHCRRGNSPQGMTARWNWSRRRISGWCRCWCVRSSTWHRLLS